MGVPAIGLGAAAGFGVALERLVVVEPGSPAVRTDWPAVLGIVVDGFDVVIARPSRSVTLAAWRRVLARLRERGGVLVAIDAPPSLEVAATITTTGQWHGLQDGAGRLQARQVMATIGGRGAMARTRRSMLHLPGIDGTVQPATPMLVAPMAPMAPMAPVAPASIDTVASEELRSAG